nr:MAG TPA: hypothetical protein [Caudoviricetes sp.]
MIIDTYGGKFKWLITEVIEKATYNAIFNAYDVDVNINGQTKSFRHTLGGDITDENIHHALALDIVHDSKEFLNDYIEVLKIDNRMDSLLSKARDVSGFLSEIQLRKEETTKLSEIIEFLDTQSSYEIWLKKHTIDGEPIEYRIPLKGQDRRNTVDMFREKLKGMIERQNDVIARQYKRLDTLLK